MIATTSVRQRAARKVRRSLPRRRSELGLLIVGGIVVLFASLLPSLALTGNLPDHELTFIAGLVGLALVIQVVNRRLVPDADPVLMPVALVLNGIGYVFISRLKDASGFGDQSGQQLAWTAIGVVVYVVVLAIVKRSRDIERYRYLMLVVAFFFLVLPIFPGIGENIQGARLWIQVGPLSFQPVEIAKILLIFFFASYVIDKRELLTFPTRRIGNHLTPDLRAFGPIAIAAAMSLLIILGEHDIGFSLILFVVFLSLLWISTGRWTYLAIGISIFIIGTFAFAHVLPQLNSRIELWLDPWKHFFLPHGLLGSGEQPIRGYLAFAHGGLFGTGLGLGIYGKPGALPIPTSDFIFSIIGEELGLIGTTAIAIAYLLMVGCGVRAALGARSEFAKLVAIGLTILLGFQAFIIMAGVVRLLPLTGVTLPFVSYGGSSLVANYALLAILMRISQEGHEEAPT